MVYRIILPKQNVTKKKLKNSKIGSRSRPAEMGSGRVCLLFVRCKSLTSHCLPSPARSTTRGEMLVAPGQGEERGERAGWLHWDFKFLLRWDETQPDTQGRAWQDLQQKPTRRDSRQPVQPAAFLTTSRNFLQYLEHGTLLRSVVYSFPLSYCMV